MSTSNAKANALFLQAIELRSTDRRTGFLDKVCAGDPALRAEVEQLLKAHDHAGSYLEQPSPDEQRTQDFAAATDPENPPPASGPARGEVSLDFLEPCDVPGRLGMIGPYEVIDVIGAGGMGVVLRAHEPKLNRIVAVKVMAQQLVVNPTARKRFLREAQAAAAVTNPHVVAIHAVEQTEKMSYLVMECISGPSLEERIQRGGHLELKEILRIGAQVAEGLAAAHAQGLVHRDIKPSNILLENGVERVRINDFGIARAVDDVGLTCTGEVAGTPQFMSPEQAEGNPVDHRSDLFSLGAVLYTMCTGRSPFRAETTVAVLRRVCDDVPRPIRDVNPDIPEQLVTIIDRLLAKAPEERFQMAQEVAEVLLIYLARLQDPAIAASPEPLNVQAASDRITRPAKAASVGRRPAARVPRRRIMMLAATMLVGLFVSVAVTEGTGVTHLTAAILRIATGAGTLVVEVDDPQVSVTIDGEDLVITGTGPKEVRLKPGRYRVQAEKGGQLVKQELVTVERGGRQVVRVALEPSPPAASPAAQSPVPLPVVGSFVGADGKWKLPAGAPSPALAPFDAQKADEHQQRWAKRLGVSVEMTNSIGMKLVFIPPGEFIMGSSKELIEEELQAHADDRFYEDHLPGEGPQHRVRITQPFYLGKYAVTQEEYQQLMGKNPSEYAATGDGKRKVEGQETKRFPVEQVSWDDAVEFCRKLSERPEERAAKRQYCLPTEARWEYACRAGSTGRYGFSPDGTAVAKEHDESKLSDYGWFSGNSGGRTHAVGRKKPNAWGLYDMHGNVWQWCQDWYDRDYYAKSPADDPTGPLGGLTRVFRGGSQELPAPYCRSARRIIFEPGWRLGVLGMRVSLVLADK